MMFFRLQLSTLSQLPPELASIPETTIDVFVSNVQPLDGDITWGKLFTDVMKQEIAKCRSKGKFKFLGEVRNT